MPYAYQKREKSAHTRDRYSAVRAGRFARPALVLSYTSKTSSTFCTVSNALATAWMGSLA